jgi:predicted P-loop ATPase
MTTIVLKRARDRRNGLIDGRAVANVIQVLEARHDATRGVSTPRIVVPQLDGSVLPLEHYQIERMRPAAVANSYDQYSNLLRRLEREDTEVVTNDSDEDFEMALNGVWYGVKARETKRLPTTLAQHMRQKLSARVVMAAYDRSLGAAEAGQAVTTMQLDQFRAAVNSYDKSEDLHFDRAERKLMF